jgi:bifunctional DNA-binding transcriptional regulator/antitoxin component of YhaV-PrlF toxin-antitoxin module
MDLTYNVLMSVAATSHVMRVSRNGQVSLPAEARHRWNADRVLVVDLGDRVVMRPLPEDAVGGLYGKYAGAAPTATDARTEARAAEATIERRRAKR